MKFFSTRNSNNVVGFKKAIQDSIPQDGGLYVPAESLDLRKWILYANEKTSFASLAGCLTSAMINDEFSPIICETIATHAFPNDPVFKKLDDNLFILELYHGASGTFKDFGVSYLTSALETILQLDGGKAILLGATQGELGACMSKAMNDKKLLKSVLLAPKGKFRGMDASDFVWNGGNIYPIEVDGNEEDCHNLIRKIFENKDLVSKRNITVANTANIGRLLPQAFFYTFAFSRLKHLTDGEIFYSFSAGNYGNLVSGLYGWLLSLPVNGFIVPSTPNLTLDLKGKCMVLDSIIPIEKRTSIDPADPSNIERLEQIFKANSLVLKSFVFPAKVSDKDADDACKELFKKYGIYADNETCRAYAASKIRSDITGGGDGVVVLVARNSPCLDSQFVAHNLGESPVMTDNVKYAFTPVSLDRPALNKDDIQGLESILNSL